LRAKLGCAESSCKDGAPKGDRINMTIDEAKTLIGSVSHWRHAFDKPSSNLRFESTDNRVPEYPDPVLFSVKSLLDTVERLNWSRFPRRSSPKPRDCARHVNGLYRAALGRIADGQGLANAVQQLQFIPG
jgi:hypothetical protein